MNSTRIEVPLTLPTPHFDDERTIATARQVKPIGRARVTEKWRHLRALLPLVLLATVCGALGAAGVNYYEDRHRGGAVAQPVVSNPVETKAEASPIAVAASATPTPNVSDTANEAQSAEAKTETTVTEEVQTKIVTQPAHDALSAKPDPPPEKKGSDADAAQLTRKRRVNSSDQDAIPANKKGAGRIADIFSGPNPWD
jgi:hypothetical protein